TAWSPVIEAEPSPRRVLQQPLRILERGDQIVRRREPAHGRFIRAAVFRARGPCGDRGHVGRFTVCHERLLDAVDSPGGDGSPAERTPTVAPLRSAYHRSRKRRANFAAASIKRRLVSTQ